jgi:tripartite-type tricarboxylate transporter receptor subunit TctC
VKSGRLRALAVTGARRSPALPDAPAIAESLPGYEVYEWNAIFVPAGTPPSVVAKLAGAIEHALQLPEVKERVAALGGEIPGYGPAEASRFVRAQAQLWGQVVRDAHIRVE